MQETPHSVGLLKANSEIRCREHPGTRCFAGTYYECPGRATTLQTNRGAWRPRMTNTDNATASTVSASVAGRKASRPQRKTATGRSKARYNAAMQDTRSTTVALVAAFTTVVISMAALRAQQPPASGTPASGTAPA